MTGYPEVWSVGKFRTYLKILVLELSVILDKAIKNSPDKAQWSSCLINDCDLADSHVLLSIDANPTAQMVD